MATALYQYFGILTCIECGEAMLYSLFFGFVGGVALTILAVAIYRDRN